VPISRHFLDGKAGLIDWVTVLRHTIRAK